MRLQWYGARPADQDEGSSMAEHTGESPSRLDRRKARTRTALVRAAQSFLAAGTPDVPILEITQAADVGLGSFYNHFDSKEQLFRAAVDDALGLFAAVLDEHAAGLDDPAHVFAQGFRLTGRLHRAQPELSRVLLNSGPAVLGSDTGPGSRARRPRRPAPHPPPRPGPGHGGGRPALPGPAAARPAGPRRRAGHRPDRRGPAPHVR